MPVTNEGLGWDSLLKMVHNPGGDDCILGGGVDLKYNHGNSKRPTPPPQCHFGESCCFFPSPEKGRRFLGGKVATGVKRGPLDSP